MHKQVSEELRQALESELVMQTVLVAMPMLQVLELATPKLDLVELLMHQVLVSEMLKVLVEMPMQVGLASLTLSQEEYLATLADESYQVYYYYVIFF